MRITKSVLLALALVLGGQSLAAAQAPAVMPLQGYLTDEAGTAIEGSTTMTFSLYTAETGGTAIYTEDQSVMVDGGYFTAYIGDVTALDLALFRDNGTVYVGIRVGAGAELAPRAQLGSVPYAAFAQHSAAVPFAGITGAPAHVTTGYTGGAGVTVTGTTVAIDTTTVQSRVTATCPAGQAIRAIAADGTVTCQAAGGSSYTAGAGLTLTGTTFSADTSYLQRRVTGTCGVGFSVRSIAADGTVVCERAYTPVRDMTRSTRIDTVAGRAYRFGCYLGSPGADWVGESVNCHMTYFCPAGNAAGTQSLSATLTATDTYALSGAAVYTAPSAGFCIVTATVEFSGARARPGLGPFFRIGYNDTTGDRFDSYYGHYPGW